MTANDVWKLAYAQVGMVADDVADFEEETVCAWLTLLLEEALDAENSIREWKGKEMLEEAPVITSLAQHIDYSSNVLKKAMPYGIGERLWMDDENTYNARDFRARFVNALSECTKAVSRQMEDVYA